MLPQRGKPIPPAFGTNNGRIDAPVCNAFYDHVEN